MNILFIPFYVTLAVLCIMWALTLWDIRTSKSKIKQLKKFPKVSFIIPAYNAHKEINQTIDSLFSQNYPKSKIEVIVYASGQNLAGYDFSKYKKHGKQFIFLQRKGKVEKAIAVNRAVKKAKADFVFIMDADTILEKNSLKKVMARFDDEKIGAVTASRIAKYTGFWSLLQNFEYVMTNIILTSYNKLGSTVGVFGCCMCFRKKAFQKINGLARVPAQDFDAALRLVENNYRVLCEIGARGITTSPTFLQWIKQRFRWMRGFTLSLINHYKVFFTKPFGLFFTIIYSTLAFVSIASFFINSGFFKSIIYLLVMLFSFKLPLLLGIVVFAGVMGWALYDRILLVVLYSCLSMPYVLYPYRKKDLLKLPLMFAYSLIYMPLFVITGIVGGALAIKDKIQGREIIKW